MKVQGIQPVISAVIPLGVGSLLGVVFVTMLGSVDLKWAIALLLLLSGSTVLLLLNTFRFSLPDVYLLFAAFLMPVIYDINFLYRENPPFMVSANGFGISAADVFVGLLALRWLTSRFFGEVQANHSVLPKAVLLLMVSLFLINTLSLIWVPYPFYTLSMLWAQVKAYVVLLLVAQTLNSEQLVQRLVYVLVATLGLQGLVAIEQKMVGVIFTQELLGLATTLESQLGSTVITRVSGTFGQPNALAMFINQLMVIAAFATWTEPRLTRKLLMAFGIFLALVAELFTASRGGWISITFAIFVCIVLWRKKRGGGVFVSTAVSGIASVFIFGAIFAASQSVRDRLLQDDHGTADVRQPLMDVAFDVIQNNPITGVGLNHYTYFMAEYDRTLEAIATNYPWPVHNAFLLSAAETGLINMGLFIAFLLLMLRMSYVAFTKLSGIREVAALGCFGGIITWVIHNQVDFTSLYASYPLWLIFGLVLALHSSVHSETNHK